MLQLTVGIPFDKDMKKERTKIKGIDENISICFCWTVLDGPWK